MATGRDAVLEIVRAYMGGTRLKETQSASQNRREENPQQLQYLIFPIRIPRIDFP
jgi:hypothetical protein